jgi:hypothetical protein
MLKNNLTEHQAQCQQITTTCAHREVLYTQSNAEEHHSDIIFLREQLRQLRQESQHEIQQLKEQIRQTQSKKQKDQMRSICIVNTRLNGDTPMTVDGSPSLVDLYGKVHVL